MKKKHVYVMAAALTLAGVVLTTALVSNADEAKDGIATTDAPVTVEQADKSTTGSDKEILKLDKEDAWTDYVPSTGRDNPVYVAEDEIIYTDSQGNKVYEYLNPVDPGNEPATMPDENTTTTQDEVQGDVMAIDESSSNNTSSNKTSSSTTVASPNNNPVLVDTEERLATGKSKVVENENGLLIQVFE